MQKQDEEEKKLPHFANFEEFIKLNQPARNKEEATALYSTSEILAMCNDIAYDDSLSEGMLLELLKGHQYDLINIGDGLQRWIIK